MPQSRKPTEQQPGAAPPAEVTVVHAEDEAAAVAALNAGHFVTADPAILEKLGFADFGEVGDFEDFLDPYDLGP